MFTLTLLAVVCVSYVLQQTLVVPALPTIGRDLDTSTTWATWIFTGFLLSSAVATPLIGKLGDTYGKKRLLVIVMVIFAVGTIGAALSTSIAMLILARALQGAAGAIFPLAFGIVRDELPPEKVGMALGLLSATLGIGAGIGLVLSGVVLESFSWQWLFWFGALPVILALPPVWFLLPESRVRTPSRVDWWGALTMSVGLGALLIALSEGEHWGWLSATTLGLFAFSVVVLVLWVWVELKVPEPMVAMGMMRDRGVMWANIVAIIVGFSMYGTFLLVPTFVQMGAGLPDSLASRIDYGFGASVIVAGLFLVPSSIAMLIVGPLGGALEPRLGAKALTGAGSVVLGLGGLMLALFHTEGWEIILAMTLIGIGVALVYAMLAKLIIDRVSPQVTGVAIGVNTVMRTIGGVIGAQVGAALLSSITIPGTDLPAEEAFTATFLVAACVAFLGAIAVLRVPGRGARAQAGAPVAEPAVSSVSAR